MRRFLPLLLVPPRLLVGIGALAGMLAVAMAAVLAHALPQRLDARHLQMVRDAVQMQGWHALALIGAGLWADRGFWLARAAGSCFLAGILLFCGAVYALALGGIGSGIVAPLGGWALMLGWLLLALSALRVPHRRE